MFRSNKCFLETSVAIKCQNVRPLIFLPTANWNGSLQQNPPDGQIFARLHAFSLRKSPAREKGLFWIPVQIAGQFFFFFSLTELKKQDQNHIISDFLLTIDSFNIFHFIISLVCNFTSSLFNFRRKIKSAAKEAKAKGDASEVISNSWCGALRVLYRLLFFSYPHYCL